MFNHLVEDRKSRRAFAQTTGDYRLSKLALILRIHRKPVVGSLV